MKITVIGTGYVGLVTGTSFLRDGKNKINNISTLNHLLRLYNEWIIERYNTSNYQKINA